MHIYIYNIIYIWRVDRWKDKVMTNLTFEKQSKKKKTLPVLSLLNPINLKHDSNISDLHGDNYEMKMFIKHMQHVFYNLWILFSGASESLLLFIICIFYKIK